MLRLRTVLSAGLGGLLTLVGCNLVLGTGDYKTDPNFGATTPDGGGPGADGDTGLLPDGGDPCNVPNKPLEELREVAADTTLTCDKDYLLINQVYVRAGATLTIQAGTTIKGQRGTDAEFEKVSVLVVQPGGKINAIGTSEKPIVFTSNKLEAERAPGDWGGVVLLGNAIVNQGKRKIEGVGISGNDVQYGGDNDDDSSGTIRYVRIEYGGFKLSENNEINGLTLGGVGRGTAMDHIQVRRVLDDCFEFFGGTVNASHLACQYTQDDGIDWDFGYRGKIQFVVVQQDPDVYDDMNGFEGDNGANATEWVKEPVSEPTIFNATLCGPGKPTNRVLADGGVRPLRTRFGMLIRRHSKAHIFNSIVMGFEGGVDLAQYPNAGSTPALTSAKDSVELRNIIFWGNTHAPGDATGNVAFLETDAGSGILANDDDGFDERTEILGSGTGNREVDPGITGCFNAANPSFGPSATIESSDVPPESDEFFIAVGYIGAFRDVNDIWATGGKWAVWSDK